VVGLYTLICGPLIHLPRIEATGWRSLLFAPRLILMVLLGGMLVWILTELSPELRASRFNARTSLLAASALIPLIAVGFVSNMRHLKGQFDNYRKRVLAVPDSTLAMDPVVASEGLFFTALTPRFLPSVPDTYAVHELKAGLIIPFAVGGDWLHPAIGRDGHPAWAEVATDRGSRVVSFSLASSPISADDITVEADNAEQPVASPDGKFVAFIRQSKRSGQPVDPTGPVHWNREGNGRGTPNRRFSL
jgi:hypothetical protein